MCTPGFWCWLLTHDLCRVDCCLSAAPREPDSAAAPPAVRLHGQPTLSSSVVLGTCTPGLLCHGLGTQATQVTRAPSRLPWQGSKAEVGVGGVLLGAAAFLLQWRPHLTLWVRQLSVAGCRVWWGGSSEPILPAAVWACWLWGGALLSRCWESCELPEGGRGLFGLMLLRAKRQCGQGSVPCCRGAVGTGSRVGRSEDLPWSLGVTIAGPGESSGDQREVGSLVVRCPLCLKQGLSLSLGFRRHDSCSLSSLCSSLSTPTCSERVREERRRRKSQRQGRAECKFPHSPRGGAIWGGVTEEPWPSQGAGSSLSLHRAGSQPVYQGWHCSSFY